MKLNWKSYNFNIIRLSVLLTLAFVLAVLIQNVSTCALHETEREGRKTENGKGEGKEDSNVVGGQSSASANSGRPRFGSLENIVGSTKSRLKSMDPTTVSSGTLKYLVLPDPERDALTLYSGPEVDIQQYEHDLEKIHSIVYSDYETYKLFSNLMEFIDDSLFTPQNHQEQTKDDGRYWNHERRADVIRKLDTKFVDEPAWGRYWNYKFDKTIDFMEKYG